jgi:hypothetical protein
VSPDVLALNPEIANVLKGKGKTFRTRKERLYDAPAFRSKTEERAWDEWIPTLNPTFVKYEPVTLHLAGGRYTPDFLLRFKDGSVWLVEVKGSWNAYISGRSSKHLLKQASVEFGWLGRWFALLPIREKDGGGWDLQEFANGRRVRKEGTIGDD